MPKVAINGLGRIGRRMVRLLLNSGFEIVALNDLMPIQTAVHLLKFDSTYGMATFEISSYQSCIVINQHSIVYSNSNSIESLGWSNLEIDFILHCSGIDFEYQSLTKYLKFHPKKIILSSPPHASDLDFPISIYGFNHLNLSSHKIISNASCTTYSVVPLLDILKESFGVEWLHFTTIHCYTTNQNLQDAAHSDLRRARAAAQNIVPTTTSASGVIKKLFPDLADSTLASSYRVPVINGSITEMILKLKTEVDKSTIYSLFENAVQSKYMDILHLTQQPIVSSDCIGMPYASIVDLGSIEIVEKKILKLTTFYDNENGYSNMLLKQLQYLSNL